MNKSSRLTSEPEKSLLRVRKLSVSYGKATAVREVDLEVNERRIVALIGSNGAGKTTILRTISGLKKAASGKIWFGATEITNMAPQEIVQIGIAHVPEGSQVFREMTVMDNLVIGAYLRRDKKFIKEDLAVMFEHFKVLRERRRQKAGTLSGGERQMLAVARAYMAAPKLMLMDEPSLGLSPIVALEIASIIQMISERGISIILVEQNAQIALSLSNYGYVLETGKITLEGTPSSLKSNENVKRAYLGI